MMNMQKIKKLLTDFEFYGSLDSDIISVVKDNISVPLCRNIFCINGAAKSILKRDLICIAEPVLLDFDAVENIKLSFNNAKKEKADG